MIVKVRKVGNSKTLTIPKTFEVNDNTKFIVSHGDDGSIIYKPERRNPFEGNWYHKNLKQVDITNNTEISSNEWG